jgi:hypothetical protein
MLRNRDVSVFKGEYDIVGLGELPAPDHGSCNYKCPKKYSRPQLGREIPPQRKHERVG